MAAITGAANAVLATSATPPHRTVVFRMLLLLSLAYLNTITSHPSEVLNPFGEVGLVTFFPIRPKSVAQSNVHPHPEPTAGALSASPLLSGTMSTPIDSLASDLPTINIAAFCGSLRAKSYNRALLSAATDQAPPGVTITELVWRDLPPYDADDDDPQTAALVERLGAQVAAADAVLFVTPEYNYSVPGGLKNAIDWLSRLKPQPFAGKTAAVMGASIGILGTARMQYHMRQIGVFLEMKFLNRPEVMVGQAASRVDADGRLEDERTRDFVGVLVAALADAARAERG